MRQTILALLIFAPLLHLASAVEVGQNTYQTYAPTNENVANWNSGWPASGVTGWNYVGQVSGTSAVYLGDNWVLTAAHVGSGPFILDGVTYPPVAKSEKPITNFDHATSDLLLFRIANAPSLPPLVISSSGPSVHDAVVMIGYGGGHGKTWGKTTVTQTDIGVRAGENLRTFDFIAALAGPNPAKLVTGDSGGGTFIYNSTSGLWELTGINEAVEPGSGAACMVQLSTYADQIESIRGNLWNQIIRWAMMALASLPLLWGLWIFVTRLRRRRRKYTIGY